MNIKELSKPFAASDIHWRPGFATDSKALALAYLDARDVMDRLDDVCGPENWSTYYEETATGRVLCKLSIRINDEWVTKTDGAGKTDVEGEKGGISDALKRAAVAWGIGRYLYNLKDVWAPYVKNDKGKFKMWADGSEGVFANALSKVGRPTGPLNDKTRDWVGAQIQSIHKTPADLLSALSPKALTDLTYDQLSQIQDFINSNKKAA